jgi:UDP-N-acetyl-D-galactosamine dehydrogenase
MIDGLEGTIVGVVGLGYVGLPLAQAFSKKFKVIGFDTNSNKIRELIQRSRDQNSVFTDDAREIGQADFIIIAVPTPVTKSKEPDLSFVESAAETIAQNMKKGATVVLESTVYPGVTEDIVRPILERSGLKCGRDFKLAYSPERINPGDEEHSLDKITKVVAGMDGETTGLVARLYGEVSPHIFEARDIKTAEAAKVIENIQRDLNIALMNELSLIFGKMGLSTKDVLEAASTKWNFHKYSAGLVGGHCIPVDPYYLVYKAKELGYHPQVILAGRAINDSMPKHVAEMTIKALNSAGKVIKGSKVLIMGLTYKEDVADIRETPARGIIRELEEYGIDIIGYDPLLNNIEREFGIRALTSLKNTSGVDCVILTVAHKALAEITLDELKSIMNANPILIDVRGRFEPAIATEFGFHYRSL